MSAFVDSGAVVGNTADNRAQPHAQPLAPSGPPTDDRSCAERGRDAITHVADFVSGRLAHYRAAGELAVTFGWPVVQRKLAERVESALGRTTSAATVGDPAWPEPAPEPAPVAEQPTDASNGHGPAPAASPRVVTELPIPGYDSLSASQVVERLTGLPAGDLQEVREYEAAHRNRRTILGKIDQLQSSA